MTHVDLAVIGAGMAGLPLALRASRHGRVALFERDLLGGTCLNRGCIPTKTMIHSAKVAQMARRAAGFGVTVGGVSVDMEAVVDRKDRVVQSIRRGSARAVEKAYQLTLIEAPARLVDAHTVEVDGRRWTADRVVINTGARPHVPEIPGLEGGAWLDSTAALGLRELPEHLIVIGAGYVGCEFAQMYRRFGSAVTIVQRSERLLPAEDPEVSQVIREVFAREGIDVRTGSVPDEIDWSDGKVRVHIGSGSVAGDHLLIATGRVPNSEGLAEAGVALDERGFVSVDASYRTNLGGVYAIGDVVGPPMFTHSARDDAALLYRHLFRGDDIEGLTRLVPHAIFTDPEVASFGMSEADARKEFGEEFAVGLEAFSAVAKARAIGETDGFVKIIVGPDRRILGATIVGPDAGNLIHELVVAANSGLAVDQVRDAIHIHPTLAEGVNAAAGGVHRPAS